MIVSISFTAVSEYQLLSVNPKAFFTVSGRLLFDEGQKMIDNCPNFYFCSIHVWFLYNKFINFAYTIQVLVLYEIKKKEIQ